MARAVLLTALTVYLLTSFRYHWASHGEKAPGKLMYMRVSARRTVEVWRTGLTFDIRIFDH
ncbi:hypothetical protein ACFV4P_34540 [Kitasatospora sp. NPDC059795]|uniref:hypothetical protein n=1 Tax=Kitasatospora sp. NPDC059795 TaxID=3346949 RepID=UPI003650B0CD